MRSAAPPYNLFTRSAVVPSTMLASSAAITTEAAARAAADTTLQTNINTTNTRIKNPLFLGGGLTLGGGTIFLGPQGANGTEIDITVPVPFGGTFKNLYVSASVAPGGIDTQTITLRKNGTDTAITCSITGAAKTASDLTHTVFFAAGDLLSIKIVSSATAAASFISCGVELDPT